MSDQQLPEYRACPKQVIVTKEWRDMAIVIQAERGALKVAARALLDALPGCGCRGATGKTWFCADQHHHDEIKALEALL